MTIGRSVRDIFSFFWRPALPLVVVLIIGWLLRNEVKASIEAMPHPELLIAIGTLALFGIYVIFRVQYRTYRELLFIRYEMGQNHGYQISTLDSRPKKKYIFNAVHNLIIGSNEQGDEHMLQSALSHELTAAENHLIDKLDLPNYISGALVVMGLLGTFIGLIETLSSMVSLIGSLTDVGAANADILSLVAHLIGELQ